ncbi:EGF-like domain-containing protein [Caenorhabditis elegans]|uniref:EGF-like domain-containing protein n=1 Tax=Caenorhabditis elegans TaxID=6239 RepID=Q9XUG6_CAEEL|nr:EGF-like domain-containing protein [Caenorhabditis elegans]CAB05152.1 EGF-like domain-containing protein [Caenorhabditis elegans]|eukprot:NP_501957.1 Uncharacterized protein CELE_C43F9.5 [Caenorhabditis elegans]
MQHRIMMFLVLFSVIPSIFGLTELGIRSKRQTHICGTYPNQFYSMFPCEYWTSQTVRNPYTCANGGRKIGVGCYYNYQCTPYAANSVCLNNCCCTNPVVTTRAPIIPTTTTRSVSALAYCYNGQRTQVRCTTSVDCAAGQTCMNGICCTTTGNEYTGSCGGLPAISACGTGQTCGSFRCTSSNYCCECQYGRTAGLCSNGCPTGYSCNSNTGNGYCCATCASGRPPFGSCFNGLCASGYTCQAGNICC